MKITNKIALKQAKALGVDLKVVGIKQWVAGLQVELEHGKMCAVTNVSNDDMGVTARIALAHLMELPDYYHRLAKMEEEGEKDWKDKDKPSVLLDGSGCWNKT